MQAATQYLTYNEYQELGGSLPENQFEIFERRARRLLDHITFDRIPHLPEIPLSVKEAMYEFITVYYDNSVLQSQTNGLSHYSNGVESLTFQIKSAKEINAELFKFAQMLLPDYLLTRCVSFDIDKYLQSTPNNL